MQVVDLASLPVVGALSRDVTDAGAVFGRLPMSARAQIADPSFALTVTMPAGVRLELRTDARELELDVMLTLLQLGDQPTRPAAFDLVVDGEVRRSVATTDGTWIRVSPAGDIRFDQGQPTTIRFDDLPGTRDAVVELWLPHTAVVELRQVRLSDGARLDPVTRARPRWAHYGSSISHCFEAPTPSATWPALVALAAGWDLQHLGFAGQCHLDQLVARTIRDLDVDLISVKAGINIINGDTMRERTFVPALHGFLDTVRDGHPTTPLVVVTPIICPGVEDLPGPTALRAGETHYSAVPRPEDLAVGALTLRRVRALVSDVVRARQAAGDDNLHLIDGLRLFGPDDLDDLPDGLHPNAVGYRTMAERFHAAVSGADGPFAAARVPSEIR